mgnify:CR=1 FL=1
MGTSLGSVESARIVLVGATPWTESLSEALSATPNVTVQVAPTAADALEVVRRGSVDCVVTAYELRDATGLELLQQLRTRSSTLPVVLCTANGDEMLAIGGRPLSAPLQDLVGVGRAVELVFDFVGAGVDDLVERSRREPRLIG